MINTNQLKLKNGDGMSFLADIKSKTINLVLTDPPYIISKESGMQKFHDKVQSGKGMKKTVKDWEKYKVKHNLGGTNKQREEYLKYGTIYGKKYAVKTDYGSWDKDFDLNKLKSFVFLKVYPNTFSKKLLF